MAPRTPRTAWHGRPKQTAGNFSKTAFAAYVFPKGRQLQRDGTQRRRKNRKRLLLLVDSGGETSFLEGVVTIPESRFRLGAGGAACWALPERSLRFFETVQSPRLHTPCVPCIPHSGWTSLPRNTLRVSDTTHGTAIYADQLGWFWGSIDRHIWQSHGVFGFGSLWHILAIVICSASMC